ncbi:hypothetical protein D3C80_1970970 [compost metagenome]
MHLITFQQISRLDCMILIQLLRLVEPGDITQRQHQKPTCLVSHLEISMKKRYWTEDSTIAGLLVAQMSYYPLKLWHYMLQMTPA